jgi:hypothetical protein
MKKFTQYNEEVAAIQSNNTQNLPANTQKSGEKDEKSETPAIQKGDNCQYITEDLIVLLKNTQLANKTISERIQILENTQQPQTKSIPQNTQSSQTKAIPQNTQQTQ